MQLRLLPVHSRLADESQVPAKLKAALPAGLRLSAHQLATYKALADPEVAIVINSAMTGDGKSLAGQLPLLVNKHRTIAMYPTNELIRDQLRSVTNTLAQWGRSPKSASELFGARLDALAEAAEAGNRSDQLRSLLTNHALVLTNPDIFHAIMQFGYQQGIAPDWLVSVIRKQYNQLIFDEFHIFDVAQVASVLTGLLFLYAQHTSYPLKTLFLSATPGAILKPLLERVGFGDQVRLIEGEYSYEPAPDPAEWRPILQAADLTLHAQVDGGVEAWIAAHLDDTVVPFFKAHGKGAKGAIIVNSVASVERLLPVLRGRLGPLGLSVLPNTGLTERELRKASYDADLLIGTSTVDVGVDFQINFLLFEGTDAGNFMQRLGRLGRHTGYVDGQGTRHDFTAFAAHALVPNFVYERLAVGYKDQPALLEAGSDVRRDQLRDVVNLAFPSPARYDAYLQDWGCFQGAHVLGKLKEDKKETAKVYADVIEVLPPAYSRLYATNINSAGKRAKSFIDEQKRQLVDEARAFRGGSPLDAGVFMPGQNEPLTYSLLWLLANTEASLLDEAAFLAEVKQRGFSQKPFKYTVAYIRVHGIRAQRENVLIILDRAKGLDWSSLGHGRAQVATGVQIDCGGFAELNALNRSLIQRKFVILIYPGEKPRELQRKARLPAFTAVYPFMGNGYEGSIAFGRQALILDSVLSRRSLAGSNSDEPVLL